jgi:hypothetical protein
MSKISIAEALEIFHLSSSEDIHNITDYLLGVKYFLKKLADFSRSASGGWSGTLLLASHQLVKCLIHA